MVRARHVTPENEPGLHTCTAFLMISGPKTVRTSGTEEGRREEGKENFSLGLSAGKPYFTSHDIHRVLK